MNNWAIRDAEREANRRLHELHARQLPVEKFWPLLDVPKRTSAARRSWESARGVLFLAIRLAREDLDTDRVAALERVRRASDYMDDRRNRVEWRRTRAAYQAAEEEERNCEMRAASVRGLTQRQCQKRRVCYRCGGPLPTRAQWWCSMACVEEWTRNHEWSAASREAFRRAPRVEGHNQAKCNRCDKPAAEANHVQPLVGRGYHRACVHHQLQPDGALGLEPLCHSCHVAETTRQIRERKTGIAPAPVKRLPPILIAPVVDLQKLSVAQQLRILEEGMRR